jgi:hypothetical protein
VCAAMSRQKNGSKRQQFLHISALLRGSPWFLLHADSDRRFISPFDRWWPSTPQGFKLQKDRTSNVTSSNYPLMLVKLLESLDSNIIWWYPMYTGTWIIICMHNYGQLWTIIHLHTHHLPLDRLAHPGPLGATFQVHHSATHQTHLAGSSRETHHWWGANGDIIWTDMIEYYWLSLNNLIVC